MTAKNKRNNQKMITEERRELITDRLLAGFTQEAIAKELEISKQAVSKHVEKIFENMKNSPQRLELRELQNARIEAIIRANWEPMLEGAPYCSGTILKCLERQSKLFGLDAPVKVAETDPDGGPIDYRSLSVEELNRVISELDEKIERAKS